MLNAANRHEQAEFPLSCSASAAAIGIIRQLQHEYSADDSPLGVRKAKGNENRTFFNRYREMFPGDFREELWSEFRNERFGIRTD